VLHVVRDPAALNRPLEVFLGVTSAAGSWAAPLVVELPGGRDQLAVVVPAEYAGATLTVLDASPFPRSCEGDRGCVALIGGPITGNLALSARQTPSPPSPPASAEPSATEASAGAGVKSIAIDNLHRVTGDAAIALSDDVRKAMGDVPLVAAILKICLSPEGKVETTKVIKSSGAPAYDDQLQRVIKASWSFEPFDIDGKPVAVCTSVTFRAQSPDNRQP
jgi:TonB family protein